jgi:hypothetical protein
MFLVALLVSARSPRACPAIAANKPSWLIVPPAS